MPQNTAEFIELPSLPNVVNWFSFSHLVKAGEDKRPKVNINGQYAGRLAATFINNSPYSPFKGMKGYLLVREPVFDLVNMPKGAFNIVYENEHHQIELIVQGIALT